MFPAIAMLNGIFKSIQINQLLHIRRINNYFYSLKIISFYLKKYIKDLLTNGHRAQFYFVDDAANKRAYLKVAPLDQHHGQARYGQLQVDFPVAERLKRPAAPSLLVQLPLVHVG